MQVNKSVLDSGLRVITARLPYLRSVSIAVAVGGGARYETKKNAGISHLLEHLILDELDERGAIATLEEHGGGANALTSEEDIVFFCQLPSRHLALGAGAFFDLLFHPAFLKESFEREKRVILEEYRADFANPGDLLMPFFTEKLWEGHPLEANSLTVILKTLPEITLQALRRLHRRLFASGNIVIAAVGDVSHKEFLRAVEAQAAALPVKKPPRYPCGQVRSKFRVEGMPFASEQVHLAYGCETISFFNPQRYALDVISSYLGKGMSSQLFIKVRSEAGLAYDITASHQVFLDTGYLAVMAVCAPENAEKVVDIVFSELQALREGRVEEKKLAAAKERLAGSLELQLEDTLMLAFGLAKRELFEREVITPDQLADKIRAVTLEEILWVSNIILDPMKFLLVMIGPIKDAKTD